MSEENKERYVVKDGYTFLFIAETRDADGTIFKHKIGEPAKAGSIIELTPEQAIGQEQKLDRVDALVIKCNNSGCFKEFTSRAYNLAYAWCPHCGGRGGKIMRIATDKDKRLNGKELPKLKIKDKDKPRVETPEEDVVDRQEKKPQIGRKSPKKVKVKESK